MRPNRDGVSALLLVTVVTGCSTGLSQGRDEIQSRSRIVKERLVSIPPGLVSLPPCPIARPAVAAVIRIRIPKDFDVTSSGQFIKYDSTATQYDNDEDGYAGSTGKLKSSDSDYNDNPFHLDLRDFFQHTSLDYVKVRVILQNKKYKFWNESQNEQEEEGQIRGVAVPSSFKYPNDIAVYPLDVRSIN